MRNMVLILALLAFVPGPSLFGATRPIVFAAYADDGGQLRNVLVLVESIRDFGGQFAGAPVWVYAPSRILASQPGLVKSLAALEAEARPSDAPSDMLAFPFAGKVFAAERAEAAAKGTASILAWMDEDTVVLKEPRELLLAKGASLGYRPVMHRNIGSLYAEQPDAFWRRVYEKLSVPESALFPMKTVADGATLRPYFNAGLLAVRPERGIMKAWADAFTTLFRDPVIAGMCAKDERLRIFMHQAALSGALVKRIGRNEMTLLSDRYNYPLFFKEMYGAEREFDDIDGVVTLRYESFFGNPSPGWSSRLKGPAEKIAWLENHLGRGENEGSGPSGTRRDESGTKLRYKFEHGAKRS
jgi:hypothetical protein